MTSQLGNYVRSERQKAGLSRQQLASMVGYKNLNKGARRIEQVELEGPFDKAIFWGIAEALGLDHAEIEIRTRNDHENHEKYLDEPIQMKMIVRLMAAVYTAHYLPTKIRSKEDAMAYAREYATINHAKVCLILSRRFSYWIDESGKGFMKETTKENPTNSPYMKVYRGWKKFLLPISA
ncbi:MAG: helix-turn-helix transcriptional regulator [Desulfobacteraceae bacterium]|jgi:transcriptional regulator with XRE-family HTH domain|nr:helix-turn-helix transcriptional regulator [Desulfobacteraceae bacterium]